MNEQLEGESNSNPSSENRTLKGTQGHNPNGEEGREPGATQVVGNWQAERRSEAGKATGNGSGDGQRQAAGEPGDGGHKAPCLPEREGIFSWGDGLEVEPWAEAVDGAELVRELAAFVRRYVVLKKYAAETLALWVVHTYGFQLRDVTTYIGIESPQKRCGKTTLLTVLNELVNRPVVASNISSPAFFRVIAEKQPTLMIDEADTVLHRNDELRGILNAGYRRKTAYVVRVAAEVRNAKCRVQNEADRASGERPVSEEVARKGSGTRLARYSSWCPKAIATIQHLPETLADRCIVLTLHRKKVTEKCERVKDLDGAQLRRKCARFVKDHAEAIGKARPEVPSDLNDRAAEIWEPLLAVADLAGDEWPGLAREAAVGLMGSGQEETAIGALLFDILICFLNREAERMFSRNLVLALSGMGDRAWGELKKGKEITEIWLARQLRAYEVRSKTMWIGGEAAKGYEKSDFDEAFDRYIPKGQAKRLLEELVAAGTPPEGEAGAKAGTEKEGNGAKAASETSVVGG
jgi:hypothetical protein